MAKNNKPEMIPETGDLDFSADNIGDWDSNTSHLDEITDDSEKIIEAEEEINLKTGLKPSETMSEDEFFTDFFCQNMALAEAMTGMSGVSVDWFDGKPEIGARETSNLLYKQCEKFRFLAWAIKRGGEVKDLFAMALFIKSKSNVIGLHLADRKEARKEAELTKAANDNNEPLADTT